MSPSLFQAYLLARTNDPQTSKDAAENIVKSGALNRQENNVYYVIIRYNKILGDFTTKDIAVWMAGFFHLPYDKAYDICRKRFSGLENKGKIELAGGRHDGCRIWKLKNE